jgi:hypothetical protein
MFQPLMHFSYQHGGELTGEIQDDRMLGEFLIEACCSLPPTRMTPHVCNVGLSDANLDVAGTGFHFFI